MHHIHHTEGIILSSRNFGEAGRYYSIFTRDLGMIFASAQGVRKMSSKLRYILQDFAYIKLDLVQGKDFWRITTASKTNELGYLIKKKEHLKIFSNISKLLRRLLAGAEANQALFSDLLSGLSILEKTDGEEELRNIEAVLVLRIVHNLGYIGNQDGLHDLVHSPFETDLVFKAGKDRGVILKEINRALKETHL